MIERLIAESQLGFWREQSQKDGQFIRKRVSHFTESIF